PSEEAHASRLKGLRSGLRRAQGAPLPAEAVDALRAQLTRQAKERQSVSLDYAEYNLVFATRVARRSARGPSSGFSSWHWARRTGTRHSISRSPALRRDTHA